MSQSIVHSAAPPSYTIYEDRTQGVVRMIVEGFFDVQTLHLHFVENTAFVAQWNREQRPIRVLIDAVRLLPHSVEGQAIVQNAIQRIYRPGDRVAILVASSLVKMQMRRSHTHGGIINFFVTAEKAMDWLVEA